MREKVDSAGITLDQKTLGIYLHSLLADRLTSQPLSGEPRVSQESRDVLIGNIALLIGTNRAEISLGTWLAIIEEAGLLETNARLDTRTGLKSEKLITA